MPTPNGSLIRQQRVARGLSLAELSEKARVTYKHLANMESCRDYSASEHLLHRIAAALEIDYTRLVVTPDDPKSSERPSDRLPDAPPPQPDRGPTAPPKRDDGNTRPGRAA